MVEEQLLTRQKLGVGFCPIVGSGKPLVAALGWLCRKAGRRSKCVVAVGLCSQQSFVSCGQCLRDSFKMYIYRISLVFFFSLP